MGIKILEGGLLTSVQDYGRYGYQKYGVNVSGALDNRALTIGNILVGNERKAAALETTLFGLKIEFLDDCFIAVTGGDLSAKINGELLERYSAIEVKRGDILHFERCLSGARSYICFSRGLDIKEVMGSCSTSQMSSTGGLKGRKLISGDVISFRSKVEKTSLAGRRYLENYYNDDKNVLRVIKGPQYSYFSKNSLEIFFKSEYKFRSDSDRMGARFEGPVIEHVESADIISDGIALGAVQVPSSGRPIVMLADRQTTGGYPKIANVVSVDIPKVAQAKPGDVFSFKLVSYEEARKLYLEHLLEMDRIEKNINERKYFIVRLEGKEYEVSIARSY